MEKERRKLTAKDLFPEAEDDPDFKPFDPYRPPRKRLRRPDKE